MELEPKSTIIIKIDVYLHQGVSTLLVHSLSKVNRIFGSYAFFYIEKKIISIKFEFVKPLER